MSALHLVCDGALLAAELVALLFSPPDAEAQTLQPARELHALARAVNAPLYDPLASVRVVQTVSHDEECNVSEPGPHEGHAQLTPDERRADVLSRPAQAWLLPGNTPRLVVVPPPGMLGIVTLTVRPASGATHVVTLGRLSSSLLIVPLAAPMSAERLAGGAVELESVEATRVVWTTLPFVQPVAFASAGPAR